jgi:uncharacterized membrane protein
VAGAPFAGDARQVLARRKYTHRFFRGAARAEPGEVEQSEEPEGGRVLALSDGVFAIAATLLALDLRVPEGLDSAGFHAALAKLSAPFTGYVIAYLVIGLLWLGHHQLFSALRTISGRVAGVNVLLLGLVALLPFPSSVLADYGDESIAVVLYAANVGSIALLQLVIVGIVLHERGFRSRSLGALAYLPSAVTAGVFLLSIPIALASPTWATLSWLLLIPTHFAVDRVVARAPSA